MKEVEFSIVEYKKSQAPILLELLLELHNTYFHKYASRRIQELGKEKDLKKSYKNYIGQINKSKDNTWKILFAINRNNRIVGFIIGSISQDKCLILNKIGKIEDWYVKEEFRGKRIGKKLYYKLEKWFVQKGCRQVLSDTWFGNRLSEEAHRKQGFFITEISFGKKLM